jgi:hypothetical protein
VTKHTSSYPSSVVLVVLVTPSLLFYLVAPGWVPGALISPGSCLCVGRVYKYALCLPDWRAQYSLVALSLGYMSRPLLSGLVRLVLVSFIDRVDKYVLAVPAWRTQYSLVTLALGYVLRPLLSELVNLVSFIDRVDKYVLAVPDWRAQYSLVTLAHGCVPTRLLSGSVLRWRLVACQGHCYMIYFVSCHWDDRAGMYVLW